MKRVTVLLLLVHMATPLQAADLLDVYAMARQHDASWLAARARYQAGLEKVPQARSALSPSVVAKANTRHNEQSVKSPTLDDDFSYRVDDYSLELRQKLYDSGQLSRLRQSRHELEQAELALVVAQQNLMLVSTREYLGLLAAQEVLLLVTAERDATGGQLELAQRSFGVGAASAVDVHEAEARLDQARVQELIAGQQLARQREALRRLTGALPAQLRAPQTGLVPAAVEPPDPEAWAQRAREANPDVALRRQSLEISRELVTRARRGFHPVVELVASHSYIDSGGNIFGFGSRSRTNQLALELEMPLYQGGLRASRVRETRALSEAAVHELALAEQTVQQAARDAYTALDTAAGRLRSLGRALGSTRKALESTRLAYEKGLRSGIDLLNSQRDYYRTERELVQSRYDYLLAKVSLRAATGELSEADLAGVNQVLTRSVALQ